MRTENSPFRLQDAVASGQEAQAHEACCYIPTEDRNVSCEEVWNLD